MYSFSWNAQSLTKGYWNASLQLNDSTTLDFQLEVIKKKRETIFKIHNASEVIVLKNKKWSKDSIRLEFPNFQSELLFKVTSNQSVQGSWMNYNKGKNYYIPFQARFASKKCPKNAQTEINTKWEVLFSPHQKGEFPAVGLFKQKGNDIEGTFLTETGDFRFLQGKIHGEQFTLACLDGSHAFLFKGTLNDSSCTGNFYSGNHYATSFSGIKNEHASLKDPETITYQKENETLKFRLNDLKGNAFSYPNEQLKGKVVIIQIMGTWCPNCLDETKFFKSLYEKYHDKGLEIISIGYEVGQNEAEYAAKINILKERLQLDFTFLVGGNATKSLASKHFESLNEIISFPTAIFVNKAGAIERIHTGFNGPSTGVYYDEYVLKTTALIESMLGINK